MLTSLMVRLKVRSGTGLVQWGRQIDDKPLEGDCEPLMGTLQRKHETQ